jgi:hypothetical protein
MQALGSYLGDGRMLFSRARNRAWIRAGVGQKSHVTRARRPPLPERKAH